MEQNFYLKRIKTEVKTLDLMLEKYKNSPYSKEVGEYIIGGQIILINSIFERGIGSLQSPEMKETFDKLYFLRQDFIHFGASHDLENFTNKALEFENKFSETMETQENYFKNLALPKNIDANNLYIKSNTKIREYEQGDHIKLYSEDKKNYIMVGLDDSFFVKQTNNTKAKDLILSTHDLANITLHDAKNSQYLGKMDKSMLKTFLNQNNYKISSENYTNHIKKINEVISRIKDKPNHSSLMNFKGETIKTHDFLYSAIKYMEIEEWFLKNKIKFSRKIRSPKNEDISFKKAKSEIPDFVRKLDYKDYYLINYVIKQSEEINKHYNMINNDSTISSEDKDAYLIGSLSQLFDIGISGLINNFSNSTKESKKYFTKTLQHRNFFSHTDYKLKRHLNLHKVDDFLESSNDMVFFLRKINERIKSPKEVEKNKIEFFEKDINIKDIEALRSRLYFKVDENRYLSSKSKNILIGKKSEEDLSFLFPYDFNNSNIRLYLDNDYGKRVTISRNSSPGYIKESPSKYISGLKRKKIDVNYGFLFKAAYIANTKIKKPHIQLKNNNTYNFDKVLLDILNNKIVPHPLLKEELTLVEKKGHIEVVDNKNNFIAKIDSKENLKINNIKTNKEVYESLRKNRRYGL